MQEISTSIFQSGQKVPVEGWYEVVGETAKTARGEKRRSIVQLTTNQLFPNYDGRAICWHLLGYNLGSTKGQSPLIS
jgi:hypothetical protein